METGIIRKWDPDRLFGFIKPDRGGADVFLHRSHVSGPEVHQGLRVTFTIVHVDGRAQARSVRVR